MKSYSIFLNNPYSNFLNKSYSIFLNKVENAKVKCVRYINYKYYSSTFRDLMKLHQFENRKYEGEDAYIKKWSVLSKRIEVYSYRLFSHYCGFTPNIIPEDIGRSFIEKHLNPDEYRPPYSDKNLFPLIIGKDKVPRTVICRINGRTLLDGNYNMADKEISEYVGKANSLILKPSVQSSAGDRIMKFEKKGDSFVSTDGKTILTKAFLSSYSRNFCLQEAVEQHPFMNMLCPTAVNTIRLCLYRSLKTNEPIVTAGIVRVGKTGSIVDNVCAGGMFVGVDVTSGELGKYLVDKYGNKKEIWNDIDYSKESLFVPHWDRVIELAEYIGSRILHHRLIALDIALDINNKPILIEYNISAFSYWLYMFTNQEVFGKYTDEVIDYCKKMM